MRIALLIGLATVVAFERQVRGDESRQFDRDIVPLLKRHCIKCHGPAKQEGKLNLSVASGLIRGGATGSAVIPHDAQASLIWQRVAADEMPPEDPLSLEEKALLKQWIIDGTAGLKRTESLDKDHWAFRPLGRQKSIEVSPAIDTSLARPTSPMDQFLLAELANDHLSFLPEADRFALIRRVSFDLTGLPPTAAAISEFAGDTGPDAYATMVERFLASPHFGERLGKVWLDAAGYADSNGYFNADSDRPLAYRYRDYVIRAINADVPFDQFIREQLAGDELAAVTARNGETATVGADEVGDETAAAERLIDRLEATHFLRNGQDGTGESDGNPDEVRIDRYTVIETTMQNISTALLGLTIQCAKCHDHKFEPLTQRDYYSLQAVLIPAFSPEQWLKPNERFVFSSQPGEFENWQSMVAATDVTIARLQSELSTWVQSNRPRGEILFADNFEESAESLADRWSYTVPGDDKPAGTAAVNLNSRKAPGAVIVAGQLQLIEGGATGDKALSTRKSLDWSPDVVGESIQVTFDLIKNQIEGSAPAERIGYFLALHDFHDARPIPGGNILVDGHPTTGSAVVVDYPGSDARPVGTLGKTGYVPGRNYGVRITNAGDGEFRLQHLVDWQVEEPSIRLTEGDLPSGGFGFEFCCGRSFVVDNVVVERFALREGVDPIAEFLKELDLRRQPLNESLKTKAMLAGGRPGKIAWSTDLVEHPPQVHVFERGNYATPGQPVEPSGFAVLGGMPWTKSLTNTFHAKPAESRSSGRRLTFANWLTQPGSPPSSLMARVQVNRYWQHIFSTGLVATADNFGLSGPPPSHPELLDWLATEFIRSGWSTKHVLRNILNSAAYRQSSFAPTIPRDDNATGDETLDRRRRADPDGRRLSRYPVHRLDAEAIRDMLLSASLDLDDRMYGPYAPTSRTSNGETIVPEDHPGARRRSVYLQQRRTQVHSLLQVFDAPSIVFNSTRRARSTMPLQSLGLLNSEFVVARSNHLADQLLRTVDSPSDRIAVAFIQTVGRPSSDAELASGMKFVGAQLEQHRDQPDSELRVWSELCQMLLVGNAALYVE